MIYWHKILIAKKYRVIAAAAVFLGISPAAYCVCGQMKEASLEHISLGDAIAIAFKNNMSIQILEHDVAAAKSVITQAQSGHLPGINVSAGYTRNGSVLNFPASQSKKDIGIFSGYKNDNRVGISLDESIYDGGATIAGVSQAQLKLRAAQESLRAGRLDVEFSVKRLYYGLLLAYETERIAQELLRQAQSHYEEVEMRFAQGESSKFDLLQSKVHVSKLTPELIRAKNAVDLISAELKKALGIKQRNSLVLTDTLAYRLIEISEEEFLQSAYLNKPEMALVSLGIDIRKWSIQMAKAGMRPQVFAGLGYSFRSNNPANMFNGRHSNWNAGFTVTIPIFDGFSTKAKVDEAGQRYAQANLEKENLGEQIAVDIRQACLDLRQAEAIITSSKDTIGEAKEALKISEISYDNGEGTNLDVLDAQVSLSQVEKNLSEGVYDYLIANAFLDRSMGKSCFEEEENEKKD